MSGAVTQAERDEGSDPSRPPSTQVVNQDPAVAFLLAMMPAVLIGLVNGIGVGVFRVHPLIMTLGTSLIGTGCLQVYQRTVIASGAKIPDFLAWLGTGLTYGVPNALLLFVPLAALIVFTLSRTGFGRLLYAVGDNEHATRLSGVQYWQVISALYIISSVLAGIAGLLYIGLIKAPPLSSPNPSCCPRWPPPSSAAPRSSAAAAATPAPSSAR
jgi:ribose transport system permease protein